MAQVDTRDGRPLPQAISAGEDSARPPAVLMISIVGMVGLMALAAAWAWVTHGPAILLDVIEVFCF
jgi:MYXO-CTERM domain-containing protein